MGWLAQHQDPLAGEAHQVVRMGQHGGYATAVCLLDARRHALRVEVVWRLIDQQQDARHPELLGDAGGDRRALVILLVRTHDDQQRV